MAIASITLWLSEKNPSYHHGRMLYEQYGDDRLVLTIIKSGTGNYHFTKLKEALELVNTKSDLVPKQIVFTPPAPVEYSQSGEKVKTNLDNAPAEVRKIRDDKNKDYAEARQLFEVIKHLDSDELRLDAGLTILDKMDGVTEKWVALDTFAATGEIMQLKQEKTLAEVSLLSVADLLKESKNLPTYISKARGNANAATDPVKKSKFQLRVQHLVIRLTEVQRRLNEFV